MEDEVLGGMEGCPVLLPLVQYLMEYMETNSRVAEEHNTAKRLPPQRSYASDSPVTTEISVLAMHHIYSDEKKQCITGFAAQLGLQGLYLYGKPGRVIIEGPSRDVREYEHEIRRLKWSKCVVLGRVSEGTIPTCSFDGFHKVLTLDELLSRMPTEELRKILMRPFSQCV